MKFTNPKASVLIEGLIIISALNVMVILMFNYIRGVATNNTNNIHEKRASLLIIDTFEKIRSARDSAVNRNKKNGWANFISEIDLKSTDIGNLILNKSAIKGKSINGQFTLIKNEKDSYNLYESHVSPFANYAIYIKPQFIGNTDKIVFNVKIRWNKPDSDNKENKGKLGENYSLEQSIMLSNNEIYENLY